MSGLISSRKLDWRLEVPVHIYRLVDTVVRERLNNTCDCYVHFVISSKYGLLWSFYISIFPLHKDSSLENEADTHSVIVDTVGGPEVEPFVRFTTDMLVTSLEASGCPVVMRCPTRLAGMGTSSQRRLRFFAPFEIELEDSTFFLGKAAFFASGGGFVRAMGCATAGGGCHLDAGNGIVFIGGGGGGGTPGCCCCCVIHAGSV